MGLIHAGMAQHGTVVFAHEQTRGKGQREKQWTSAPGENIMLSVIMKPFSLAVSQQFLLSMAVANGVHSFFSKYAGAQTKIKWPNDLYWCDRKAGGILIENQIQGQVWKYAVVGIGININQTNFQLIADQAVSLKQVTGKQWDIIEGAKELIKALDEELKLLLDAPGEVSKRYHRALYKWKEEQAFKKNNKVFKARVDGVTNEGYLIISHAHQEFFKIGEVQWVFT